MVKGSKPFGPAPAFREPFLTRTLASKLVPANTQVQGYMEFNPAGWDRATFDSNSVRCRLSKMGSIRRAGSTKYVGDQCMVYV